MGLDFGDKVPLGFLIAQNSFCVMCDWASHKKKYMCLYVLEFLEFLVFFKAGEEWYFFGFISPGWSPDISFLLLLSCATVTHSKAFIRSTMTSNYFWMILNISPTISWVLLLRRKSWLVSTPISELFISCILRRLTSLLYCYCFYLFIICRYTQATKNLLYIIDLGC